MQKNKISLIGTTQGGREFEIERLLQSLSGSSDFLELIFVDQTSDTQLEEIVAKYKSSVSVKLIKSSKVSLSKARNLALAQATGNIFGFCDDDAFYDMNSIISLANQEFKENTLLSVPVFDRGTGRHYGGRNFNSKDKKLTFLDIIRYSISVGTFIFIQDKTTLLFDENLGAGTKLGGSEETELFFRLKTSGFKTIYTPKLFVYHDNDNIISSNEVELSKKYYKYALGYGYVLRSYMRQSNFLLVLEVFNISARCVLGMLVKRNRRLYYSRLKGFYSGFFIN